LRLKTLIPKSEVRKLVVERRSEVSQIELDRKTDQIINRLAKLDDFQNAQTVHCYVASRPGEVNTKKLIDFMVGRNMSVVLPKLNKSAKTFQRFNFMGWDELVKNSEGYWEPKIGLDEDLSDIDLIIVPAMAVTLSGYRIGYGGRYYDKLLKNIFVPKYCLAFEFQVFDKIETDPHDIRVDKIVTERRVIDTTDQSSMFH
jgi:5-formyltetrahydrofolate cyclo-ligase